jgi:hypothetical protein
LLASSISLGTLSYFIQKSLPWLYHQISLIHGGLFESNKVTNISHLPVLRLTIALIPQFVKWLDKGATVCGVSPATDDM